MNITLGLSLLLVVASFVLAISNGFIFFGTVIIFLAAATFVFYLNPRTTVDGRFISALFALGLSSSYLSTYLWVFGNELNLTSDAYLYDRVAQDIASTISLYSQINFFSYDYVNNIAQAYGYVVNQAGFYKILGIAYSLGRILNITDPSIQIPATINCISYLIIGATLYKIFIQVGFAKRIRWFLLYTFLTTPFLIDQTTSLRKDTFLLAITLLVFILIIRRYRAAAVTLIIFIVTIRLPQAALLFTFFIIYEGNLRNIRLLHFTKKKYLLLSLLLLSSPFIVMLHSSGFEISQESLNALMLDRENASLGLSTYLTKNVFGVALYGILYPFPNLIPTNITSLINTLYAYIHLFMTITVIINSKIFDRSSYILNAVFVLFILTYSVYAFAAVLSWKSIGFVVFEARYKYLGIVCMFILFGHLMNVYFSKKNTRNTGILLNHNSELRS